MFYVALKPDKTPLGIYPDMPAAQAAIAAAEPDVLRQAEYQIHPVASPRDADALRIKVQIHYKLEKFHGEYAGQEPFEVIEGEG